MGNRDATELSSDEWFRGHYDEWYRKRLGFLQQVFLELSMPVTGLRVLEVGAGHGDVGNWFARRGAHVTSTDGRLEHVRWMASNRSNLNPQLYDVETDDLPEGDFDVLVHFGLLYHLCDPLASLKRMLKCNRFSILILETEVSNSSDPNFVLPVVEDQSYDQGLSGVGGRPSAQGVEAVLEQHFAAVQRYDLDSLNSSFHEYSWSGEEVSDLWRPGLRRMWVAQQ